MAIIGGDQGKAGESKGSGRKADDLRLSCLCLLLIQLKWYSGGITTNSTQFEGATQLPPSVKHVSLPNGGTHTAP